MKPFQTLLFLAIIILIGGMAALYWGKSVEDVPSSVVVVEEPTEPANLDVPVEEPGDQNTPSQPTSNTATPSAIGSIILVDDLLPAHDDAFSFVANEAGKSVWVDGDTLYVNVGYSGGCQEHEFNLYWHSLWAESDPPQTGVRLIHDSNDDFCEAYLTQTLQFDLSSITSDYQIFYLSVQGYTESISLFIE